MMTAMRTDNQSAPVEDTLDSTGTAMAKVNDVEARAKRDPMDLLEYQTRAVSTDQLDDTPSTVTTYLHNMSEKLTGLSRYHAESIHISRPPTFQAHVADNLGDLLWYIASVARRLDLDLSDVAEQNLAKTAGRWGTKVSKHGLFDEGLEPREQLPRSLSVRFEQLVQPARTTMLLFVQLIDGSEIQIGDQITDNAYDDDGYRFHDVFHLAHAAILGWSPVVRALLKRKRKSLPKKDENDDGQRASLIEEALTAFVFQNAKPAQYFEGASSVEYGLLRTIDRLTAGLEVKVCTYAQWTRAILDGYKAFRGLVAHNGGIVSVDLAKRAISFRAHN